MHDQAEYAAAIVASAAGILHVTHGFGDVLPKHRVARTGDDVADLWRDAGLEPRPYGGSYDHLYLDLYPPSLALAPRDHIHVLQRIRPVPPLAVDPASRCRPTFDISPAGRWSTRPSGRCSTSLGCSAAWWTR